MRPYIRENKILAFHMTTIKISPSTILNIATHIADSLDQRFAVGRFNNTVKPQVQRFRLQVYQQVL
jgi:hypothetical protein